MPAHYFRTQLSKSDKILWKESVWGDVLLIIWQTVETYLEIAIDAQHGGFPSRLLDVTYNCLAALYFAVTPYYTKEETSGDSEDGMVYIFFLEDLYCPTGNNINEAYNACINHEADWFSGQELFQKNHKLIDHIKKEPAYHSAARSFHPVSRRALSSFPNYRYEAIKNW